MKELEGFKRKHQEAEIALRSAKEKVSELEAKRKALESELPLLEMEIKKAEKTKDGAFTQFALNEISDVKLEDVRKAYGLTIDKQAKAQELIEGIKRAKREIENNIPQLQQKVIQAERELWAYVLEGLKSKISKEQREIILKAFAVASGYGLCVSYETFLVGLFPQPPIEENEKLKLELIKEYLGE